MTDNMKRAIAHLIFSLKDMYFGERAISIHGNRLCSNLVQGEQTVTCVTVMWAKAMSEQSLTSHSTLNSLNRSF